MYKKSLLNLSPNIAALLMLASVMGVAEFADAQTTPTPSTPVTPATGSSAAQSSSSSSPPKSAGVSNTAPTQSPTAVTPNQNVQPAATTPNQSAPIVSAPQNSTPVGVGASPAPSQATPASSSVQNSPPTASVPQNSTPPVSSNSIAAPSSTTVSQPQNTPPVASGTTTPINTMAAPSQSPPIASTPQNVTPVATTDQAAPIASVNRSAPISSPPQTSPSQDTQPIANNGGGKTPESAAPVVPVARSTVPQEQQTASNLPVSPTPQNAIVNVGKYMFAPSRPTPIATDSTVPLQGDRTSTIEARKLYPEPELSIEERLNAAQAAYDRAAVILAQLVQSGKMGNNPTPEVVAAQTAEQIAAAELTKIQAEFRQSIQGLKSRP